MQVDVHRPVLLRTEATDLLFPLHDHAQRHGLHAAGARSVGDRLPQERRDEIADQPIEDAPRLLRLDLLLVHAAGVLERLRDRGLGDLIERDPVDLLIAVAQELGKMRGDGFPFAVGVGSQIDVLRVLGGVLQLLENLRLSADRHEVRFELLVEVHPEL